MCGNNPEDNLLLTDVGYFISHHEFIVVDSGIWNIRLVSHRHNVQFLLRELCTKKKIQCWRYCVNSRCIYFMLCLTIWMLICWWGLSIEARESRKGSMAGSESCPQLISIRILTFLSNTAILMASSMSGQYLFDQRTQSEDVKQKR